jgi:pullulanase
MRSSCRPSQRPRTSCSTSCTCATSASSDPMVPEQLRGRYGAFALNGTAGAEHLQALADAGLTHVHLLPVFDIATVRERRADRVELDDPVAELCVANPAAAGLCPTHSGKTVPTASTGATTRSTSRRPEGSYATDPDGAGAHPRVPRDGRGAQRHGPAVVMDVVYNHTNAAGQADKSRARPDRPGYYHRQRATRARSRPRPAARTPPPSTHDGEAHDRLGAHLGDASTRSTASAST